MRRQRTTVGSTTPLPTGFAANEPGLLTLSEYIEQLNPRGRRHPSSAYDFDLFDLNKKWSRSHVGRAYPRWNHRATPFEVHTSTSGMYFTRDDRVVGVLLNGTLYHDAYGEQIPDEYRDTSRHERGLVPLPIENRQLVKYVAEYLPQIDDVAKRNIEKYPVVLRQFSLDGELMAVRAPYTPVPDEGTNLAVLDSQGRIVGVAQNEWGATLIAVAQEARGRGLGKVLSATWYQLNPRFESGGMTDAGEALAIARWAERVREFRARGWYSDLIRTGRLTRERVNEILASLPPRTTRDTTPAQNGPPLTGVPLIMSDGDFAVTIYDSGVLADPAAFIHGGASVQQRYIYGHAFLRASEPVGVFVFSIDYDRPLAELTTRAILQLAKDNGDRLYDGEGYHDLLEGAENLPGVRRDGDYLVVTQDLLPLRRLAAQERQLRRAVDPYRELEYALMEAADTKWR